MAACKLLRHCTDNKILSMLEAILENKTTPQSLAGLEAFSFPQVIAPMSDSQWDSYMRNIARQTFSGMVSLYLQEHTPTACKLTPMCGPAPPSHVKCYHFCIHFAGLQQDLKMVRLSANTCAKLLQAARRLYISFLGDLQSHLSGPSRSTVGSIEPSALDPSPVASGPADLKAAAERLERQSSDFKKLAGASCCIWEYCIEADHKMAQSDAKVVWDMYSFPGTNVHC